MKFEDCKRTKVPEIASDPSKGGQILPHDAFAQVQRLAVGAGDGGLAQALDEVDEGRLLFRGRLLGGREDGVVRVPEEVFEGRFGGLGEVVVFLDGVVEGLLVAAGGEVGVEGLVGGEPRNGTIHAHVLLRV